MPCMGAVAQIKDLDSTAYLPRPARSLKMPMAVSLSGIARQTESGDRAFAGGSSSSCQPLASLAGQPCMGAVAQIKDLDSTASAPAAVFVFFTRAAGAGIVSAYLFHTDRLLF